MRALALRDVGGAPILDAIAAPKHPRDEVKRCSVCGETKHFSEFHRSERQRDGRERCCAACRSQRRGISRGLWGTSDARAFAEEQEAAEKQRVEDEQRDQETAAILRAQREKIAGR